MTEETAEDMMTAEKIEEAGPEVMTEAEGDHHQDPILATNCTQYLSKLSMNNSNLLKCVYKAQ